MDVPPLPPVSAIVEMVNPDQDRQAAEARRRQEEADRATRQAQIDAQLANRNNY